jgi:hypothetical protein
MKDIDLQIGREKLQQVNTYRYLGIEMDVKLTYSSHTERVITKAKQTIGALGRAIRKWAPEKVIGMAVTTIALPMLLYAVEVWHPPGKNSKVYVEKLQKFAARIVTNDFQRDVTYESLLQKLAWKPIYMLVMERRLMMMKSYMDGKRPFPESIFSVVVSASTRTSQRLADKVSNHSLKISYALSKSANVRCKDLAASNMCQLWNALTEEVVRQPSSTFRESIHSDEVFALLTSRGEIEEVNGV